MARQYLTSEAYKKFQKELLFLKTVKRQEVKTNLQIAKSYGDLSENAAYSMAKKAQIETETRIRQLEELLKTAKIIRHFNNEGIVKLGAKITIVNTRYPSKERVFSIVGSLEAQPAEGKVSNESPLGRAFIGHCKGEEVLVNTPKGAVKYRILDIS